MAGEPMYQVIADDLRGQIESGELAPGTKLKTEEKLREQYGRPGALISRTTVRDAIKLLVARGMVESRAGQGTFVLGRKDPFVSKLTADPAAGGVEDAIYRSEVERQGRELEETRPRVEVKPPRRRSPSCCSSTQTVRSSADTSGDQLTAPVLDADHLLPDEVRHEQLGHGALGL